jgi:coronin-1B/1C/6
MSKRIVRSSKFRHVFGTAEKTDKCFANIKISKSPFESNMCAVNPKFLAVVLEAQGGGAFTVVRMDKVSQSGTVLFEWVTRDAVFCHPC